MKISFCFAAALLLLAPSLANAHEEPELLSAVKKVSAHLDQLNELWPLAENKRDRMNDVVFRLQIGDRAWQVDDGQVTLLEDLPYPGDAFDDFSYGFSQTADNQPTVDLFVNTRASEEITGEEIAAIAVHEAFHEYVQAFHGWPTSIEDERRSTLLPADVEPRILRQQIITALKRAWIEPEMRALSLAEARTAYDRYLQSHPLEARQIRSIDIAEGTAEYLGVAFAARALAGWDAPANVIRAKTLELLDSIDGIDAQADAESYSIGLYAGLLLQDRGSAGWQSLVESMPPLQVLLQDVSPADRLVRASAEDIEAVTEQVASLNADYAARAEEVTRDWRRGGRFVALSGNIFPENRSVAFEVFATTADLPHDLEIGLGFLASVKLAGQNREIGGDVILSLNELYCGGSDMLLREADLDPALIPMDAPTQAVENGGTVICLGEAKAVE